MGSQAKECRKKMTTILTTELAKLTINDAVKNFMGDTYVEKITKVHFFLLSVKVYIIRTH